MNTEASTDDMAQTDEYGDLSAEDLGEDNDYFVYDMTDSGELILRENNAAGPDMADAVSATPSGDSAVSAGADSETAEADQGELSESVVGEAVLASVTLSKGYFSNAKLGREQMRARNKEILMNIVSDETVADELKQEAIDEIIAITARAEKENEAEILLSAKGYEGVVVSLSENEVDVVVDAESITLKQVAKIEDIVSRKTGIGAEGIVITTVVTEE